MANTHEEIDETRALVHSVFTLTKFSSRKHIVNHDFMNQFTVHRVFAP